MRLSTRQILTFSILSGVVFCGLYYLGLQHDGFNSPSSLFIAGIVLVSAFLLTCLGLTVIRWIESDRHKE